jgi:hypothetical protein
MTKQEKSSSTINYSSVEQYKLTGDQYLHNAIELVDKKELRKASELLWGAITQYLKALAANKDISLIGLKDLYQYVRELAKEQNNEYIYNEFRELHVLHTNFYDENVPEDDFPLYYARAMKYMATIIAVLSIAIQ